MFVEMSCQCGAGLQLDGVNEMYTMLMSTRFADSHVDCGFVTPIVTEEPNTRAKRSIDVKPKVLREDDED